MENKELKRSSKMSQLEVKRKETEKKQNTDWKWTHKRIRYSARKWKWDKLETKRVRLIETEIERECARREKESEREKERARKRAREWIKLL